MQKENNHFGMGLSETSISVPERRDRLLLISAIAILILTLLGATGEKLGMDRHLKANTVKHRTMSLFRQGCHYYNKILHMEKEELKNFFLEYKQLLYLNKVAKYRFCWFPFVQSTWLPMRRFAMGILGSASMGTHKTRASFLRTLEFSQCSISMSMLNGAMQTVMEKSQTSWHTFALFPNI